GPGPRARLAGRRAARLGDAPHRHRAPLEEGAPSKMSPTLPELSIGAFPPPSPGEVSASYADGGGRRHGLSLQFQIMICNTPITRLGLCPSVADYRDTSPETGEGNFQRTPS